MTTLITGGTGLIGACLAEKLLARGERVVLFDLAIAERRIAPLRAHGDRLQVVQGDVQSVVALLDVVRAHGVTAIVHLAYLLGHACNQSPERATRVNILGTVNVLEAARLSGLERVLLASSIAVYGSDEEYAPGERPLREDVSLRVASGLPIYGGGKLYLEHLARNYAEQYGLTVAGLRPSIVYGWGRESGSSAFTGEMIDRAAVGQPGRAGASCTSRTSRSSSRPSSTRTRGSSRAGASSTRAATPAPCASWSRSSSALSREPRSRSRQPGRPTLRGWRRASQTDRWKPRSAISAGSP